MTKSDDGFKELGKTANTSNAAFTLAMAPAIRLTSGTNPEVWVPESVYEELGRPAAISYLVNPKTHLLKIIPTSEPSRGNRQSQEKHGPWAYKLAKNKRATAELPVYVANLPRTEADVMFLNALPRGYYTSIGGGVFKHHGTKPPLK